MRVAVLGANGQVGAELCLLLARRPGIDVVPISRSRMGSAFLRSQGVSCRHGQASESSEAARLYGDCDVVVNLALLNALRNPRRARRENRALIRKVPQCLGNRGRHLYFSTMSVYGDAEVGERWPIRHAYARSKLESEKVARQYGVRHGCPTYIFRLGHVCGELQGITKEIRDAIKRGPVALPDPGRPSNTVHVATIVDAIVQAGSDRFAAGVYDLMNVPQWSWREVFVHEAAQLGVPLEFRHVADRRPEGARDVARRMLAVAMLSMGDSGLLRRVASRVLPSLPLPWYRRLKAMYAVRSAGRDIAGLRQPGTQVRAVFRKPVGDRFPDTLRPTQELLSDPGSQLELDGPRTPWPDDIP